MSTRRSLAWIAAAQAGTFALQFGGSVIVARLLTPAEVGVFAVSLSIIGLLNIVQALGLQSFVVREPELTPALMDAAFTINAALALILAAGLFALGWFGGPVLGDGIAQVLRVIAVMPALGIFELRPLSNLERAGNFRALALSKLAGSGTTTVVTVALAAAGQSYLSMAVGQDVGAALSIVLLSLFGRRFVNVRVGLAGWRQVVRFGTSMLLVSGVNVVASRSAELLLTRLQGLAAFGLYSRASNLNNLLWDNVHIVLGRVLLVDFVNHLRDGLGLRQRYLRALEMVTGLLWPAFAGLAILSGPVIHLLYGAKWMGAAPPLAMLAVAAMVLVAISMTWEIFVACGETARQARTETIRSLAGLCLFAAGAWFGLTAAAFARVLEAGVSVAVYWRDLARLTQTVRADFLPIYGRSAAVTAAAVAPSVAVMALNGWSAGAPFGQVAASVAVGGGLWLGALWLTGHVLLAEMASIAGSAWQRRAKLPPRPASS